MKQQIENLKNWIKEQPIKGCISGSSMLDYFDGQDVDVFLYSETQFTKLFYFIYRNNNFQLSSPLEVWKADDFMENGFKKYKNNIGVYSIKFLYNNCIIINIVYKVEAKNIYSVLASFDMDILARGYDISTKKFMDLSEPGNIENRKASWNRHNTKFYKHDLWTLSSIFRYIIRLDKFYKRNYNLDDVALKFIEITEEIGKIDNHFVSEKFDVILEEHQKSARIVKKILEKWLEIHSLTEEELVLIEKASKL